MQQSVVRYLPHYREREMIAEFTARLTALLVVVVVSIAIIASVVYVTTQSRLGDYRGFYFPCILLIIFSVVFTVYANAFVANLQPGRFSRYQVVQAITKLLFSLLFVMLVSRNVVGLVIGSALSYGVLLAPMVRELDIFASLRKTRKVFDSELAKKFLLYGFPIVGQSAAKWLLDLSDRFVIGIFKGPEQVGIYAPNYNFGTTVIAFIAGPVLFAAHPLIVNAWEGGNKERIQEVIATCSRYFLLVTLPVGAFASVFSRQIMSVLVGEAFREGYVIVPLVSGGMILFNFGMYGHKGIKLLEKTGLLFAMVLVCAAANVGLNMVLVPLYGYFGAAVATFFSYGLYPVMVFWVTRRHLPWLIPWRTIRNIGVAVLAAAGFWWLLRRDLTSAVDWVIFIGLSLGGFTIYLLVLFFVGELRDYEKKFFKSQIVRISGKRN